MSVSNTSIIHEYATWYGLCKDQLTAYTNWLDLYGALHPSWHDEPQNVYVKKILQVGHLPLSCILTGKIASGKSFAINQIFHHQKIADNLLALESEVVSFPVLHQDASTQVDTDNSQTPNASQDFTSNVCMDTGLGNRSIVPVILMHDKNAPTSCYFLKNESSVSNQSFAELSGICSNLTERLNQYWQMIVCHSSQEMKEAISLINRTQVVSKDQANSYGFDASLLPSSHGDDVEIPAWRLVVINVPHPLLSEGVSLIDTPALDSLYYRNEDINVLLEGASNILHTLDLKIGLTRSDTKLFKQIKDLHIIKTTLLFNANDAKKNEYIAKNAHANTDNVFTDISHIEPTFSNLAVQRKNLLKDTLLHPLLKQMIAQSNLLKKDIEKNEAIIKINTKLIEQKTREHVHANDDVERYTNKIKSVVTIFANTDANELFQQITTTINEESLIRYAERARSLLQASNNSQMSSAAVVDNARNIMLSGLKLDLKRALKKITQTNNSMRALYNDLGDDFQEDVMHLNLLMNTITKLENSNITLSSSVEESFEQFIYLPLKNAYTGQTRIFATWYDKHNKHLQDPLKLYRQNLACAQEKKATLEKVLSQKGVEIRDASNSLAMSHQAMQEIFNISQQTNRLLRQD